MILKSFEINKINLITNKIILFYGKNEGYKNEEINKIKKRFETIEKYDEKKILDNIQSFYEQLTNESLFEKEKLIIIDQTSDKIINIIKDLLEMRLKDVWLILNSGILEKKSKLRNLFEKRKNLIVVPVYEDEMKSLMPILNQFLKEHKIKISRESINLLLERSSNSRENLNNELKKILNYSISNKIINFETIRKLTNLSENFSVNELADQYLCKNTKNVTKILNENNYNEDDCILILRTILNKSKRLLNIIEINRGAENIDKVISDIKPPIFWKDKENVKKQANMWGLNDLKNKIYEINEIESLVKRHSRNSLNLVSNFVINF